MSYLSPNTIRRLLMFLVCILYKPHLAPFKLLKLHTHTSIKGLWFTFIHMWVSFTGVSSCPCYKTVITKTLVICPRLFRMGWKSHSPGFNRNYKEQMSSWLKHFKVFMWRFWRGFIEQSISVILQDRGYGGHFTLILQ